MDRCIRWYLPKEITGLKVADLGSNDVNGSYRSLFPAEVDYVGYDLEAGEGVDVVLQNPYEIPADDASFDVVLSGQMLEHCAHFWRVFTEIARVLKPGGMAFIIAPSKGPIHRYPVDCYRFYPDAYQALADWSGLQLVHAWLDPRGPWEDLTGVFCKSAPIAEVKAPVCTLEYPDVGVFETVAEVEQKKGQRDYLEVLQDIHEQLAPKLYLEIGVRQGGSLRLSRGRAVGIDPRPDYKPESDAVEVYRCTSDDFFFFHAQKILDAQVELAFIDGMHLSEYVLRDFMNVERYMSPAGMIVIDDIFPNHPVQASRARKSKVWTGDVWKIIAYLKQERPDLELTLLDTHPTGLLLIRNLNPKEQQCFRNYNPDMRRYRFANDVEPPQSILEREGAINPDHDRLSKLINKA